MSASAAIQLELDTPELAHDYDRSSSYQFEHGKLLVAKLGLSASDHVLDVGSGTGRLGHHVAGLVPEGQVTGIDPLPLRVEIANRKAPLNFRSRIGNAQNLSAFSDESFDAVYLNSVFHWVEDKPKALAEISRVLKPGGRLALNSADPAHPHQSALILRGILSREGLTDGAGAAPSLAVTADQLAALLAGAGFEAIQVELHTFVDFHPDAQSLLDWSASSSFGNFLSRLDGPERERVKTRLAQELEPLRTPEGIRLERHLNFASALRP